MDLNDLRTLLDFHYWARDHVLAAAETLTPEQYHQNLRSSFPSVRDTLVHTYSAEWVWHSRWVGTSPEAHLTFSDYPDVASLRSAWLKTEADVRAFVEHAGEEGVERVHAYNAFNGAAYSSRFREMVQHLVNHGTYHRGQVTTMLRQLGAAPSQSLDLIVFYRERASGALRA